MSPQRHRVLDRLSTAFNCVVVEQTGKRIDFAVAGASFATWHPTDYLTGYSWDAITAGCLCHADGPPRRILLLGLAGGTVARQLRRLLPDMELDAVEIDPGVVELGNTYMALRQTGVRVHIADAYPFLRNTRQRYDVIADDVYLTGYDDVERPRMPGQEWLNLIRNRLAPGGVALANFVTGDHHDGIYRAARSVFSRTFPIVREIAPPRGYNRILVGGQQLAPVREVRQAGQAFSRSRDRIFWQRLGYRHIRPRN